MGSNLGRGRGRVKFARGNFRQDPEKAVGNFVSYLPPVCVIFSPAEPLSTLPITDLGIARSTAGGRGLVFFQNRIGKKSTAPALTQTTLRPSVQITSRHQNNQRDITASRTHRGGTCRGRACAEVERASHKHVPGVHGIRAYLGRRRTGAVRTGNRAVRSCCAHAPV